jgi:hypothetical protein
MTILSKKLLIYQVVISRKFFCTCYLLGLQIQSIILLKLLYQHWIDIPNNLERSQNDIKWLYLQSSNITASYKRIGWSSKNCPFLTKKSVYCSLKMAAVSLYFSTRAGVSNFDNDVCSGVLCWIARKCAWSWFSDELLRILDLCSDSCSAV